MDDTWRVLEALGAGPALPNRFNPLERLLESAVQSARLKSTPEVQMSGILAFCEEMQRILKIAFIGTFGGRRKQLLRWSSYSHLRSRCISVMIIRVCVCVCVCVRVCVRVCKERYQRSWLGGCCSAEGERLNSYCVC